MADAQGGSEFGKASAKRCGMRAASMNIGVISIVCAATPTIRGALAIDSVNVFSSAH